MSVSVIIPARDDHEFLVKTVDSLFANSTGDIEVIVILDGYWPSLSLGTHKNLIIIHKGSVYGMKPNINEAARIASGKYIMKLDAHCLVAEGFDEVLKADCEYDWLSIPSMYSLDPEKWERKGNAKDYLLLTYPYIKDDIYGKGFHGRKWHGEKGITGDYWHREKERKIILIDDIMTIQGSCWFMHKEKFFDIECFDVEQFGTFFQESQEICFKVWLSGGRVIRNKKTWYAHLHKGKKYGTPFKLSKKRKYEIEDKMVDYWMNDKWPGQTRDFSWLIDKFWPLEGWPDDWKELCDNI